MAFHYCSECQEYSEKTFQFVQGSNDWRLCTGCLDKFPPRGKLAEILAYKVNLLELPGIGLKLAKRIAAHWYHGDVRARMLSVKGDPYRLMQLDGIGFKKADLVAMHVGIPKNSPRRREAATRYVLEQEAQSEGHTWMIKDALETKVSEFGLTPIFEQEAILVRDGRVALRKLYEAEEEVAQRLIEMVEPIPWEREIVLRGTDVNGKEYDLKEDQIAALQIMLQQRLFVLLGAAGTGKTFLIKTLIDNFATASEGHHIALAAPTGKAARRMSETTGQPASTIHRLLEATGDGVGGWYFARDEHNPLDEGIIIIDEMSMTDVRLMRSLVRAVPDKARLVLIGDPWQLPSVGAGDVLRDITNGSAPRDKYGRTGKPPRTGCPPQVPYVELSSLKRQDPHELLAANCQRVRVGRMIETDPDNAVDFFFQDELSGQRIINDIVSLVNGRIQKNWPGVEQTQIQVITALRERSDVSVQALNIALRAVLNPRAAGIEGFQVGDRVIQTKNDYELNAPLGVMNGELGVVVGDFGHKKKRYLQVKFDNLDKIVDIPPYQQSLEFAWALTCHRAQGSEWPIVILPVHKTMGERIPKRRWLYTALSRGKQATIVIGDREEMQKMIQRSQDIRRQTWLGEMMTAPGPAGGQEREGAEDGPEEDVFGEVTLD